MFSCKKRWILVIDTYGDNVKSGVRILQQNGQDSVRVTTNVLQKEKKLEVTIQNINENRIIETTNIQIYSKKEWEDILNFHNFYKVMILNGFSAEIANENSSQFLIIAKK